MNPRSIKPPFWMHFQILYRAVQETQRHIIKIISRYLPFIGYPKSLNALCCVNDAANDTAM